MLLAWCSGAACSLGEGEGAVVSASVHPVLGPSQAAKPELWGLRKHWGKRPDAGEANWGHLALGNSASRAVGRKKRAPANPGQ